MNNDEIGCVMSLIVGLVVVIGACLIDSASCHARFPGMEASWGPIKGCLVNTEKGWIPAENYRVL